MVAHSENSKLLSPSQKKRSSVVLPGTATLVSVELIEGDVLL